MKCLFSNQISFLRVTIVTLVLAAGSSPAVFGQSTAFTYQGQLKSGGVPANGQYDFQFALFDGATGGTQQGGTLTFDGNGTNPPSIAVAGGLFTVPLDFGNQYPGAARYLEISVQQHGGSGYTTLVPRQPLTPAPYALSLVPGAAINAGSSGLNTVSLESDSALGDALFALHTATNGVAIYGESDTGAGATGVFGFSSQGVGVYGGSDTGQAGVSGYSTTTGAGVYGAALWAGGKGVYGFNSQPNSVGVYGEATAAGSIGVYGKSNDNAGTYGVSTDGSGVYGESTNDSGVYGYTGGLAGGVTGVGPYIGVAGERTGPGLLGAAVYGVADVAGTYAGEFFGNVYVQGMLFKGGGGFKIDHPTDPANKYLFHSFVESPDMKNFYDGVATTDTDGYATVTLPEWFEVLNKDFRYQLTVIDEADGDTFVQAKVAKKIHDNHFTIRTSQPNVEVSWLVTGIRQDAFANQNRIPVEQDKPADEQGRYLHPTAFGLPETMRVGYEQSAALRAQAMAIQPGSAEGPARKN